MGPGNSLAQSLTREILLFRDGAWLERYRPPNFLHYDPDGTTRPFAPEAAGASRDS